MSQQSKFNYREYGFSLQPVIEQDGQWFFFDETWTELIGPFATEAMAVEALHGYCEDVL